MKVFLPLFLVCFNFTINAQVFFQDDFEDENISNWTLVDQDSDPANTSGVNYDAWHTFLTPTNMATLFPELGYASVVSNSFADQAMHPDNLLISPSIDLTNAPVDGLLLNFIAGSNMSTGSGWYQEHYAVYVTTSSDPAVICSSTPIYEVTLPGGAEMFSHTIDFSSYSGQIIYLTFRHYNCTDENILFLDNISIQKLFPNDVSLESIDSKRYFQINSSEIISYHVKNTGVNPINSLILNWSDGIEHIDTVLNLNIQSGAEMVINHSIPLFYSTIIQDTIICSISKVNSTLPSIFNSIEANINTVSQIVSKNVVFEEGTGTWCGNCPRGTVAVEHMELLHPNNFIGIALHTQDPMGFESYVFSSNMIGFPTVNVDRVVKQGNATNESFENYFNARSSLIPPAEISIFASLSGLNLTLDLSSTFYSKFDNSDFRMSVVLTEDNVTGTGSGYDQHNYLSGGNIALVGAGHNWQTEPSVILAENMEYDHVARAILGSYDGQLGSIPTVISDGLISSYTFNYVFDETDVINNFNAIALLLDNATGEILNAKKIELDFLGLKNLSNEKGFSVYPNPANEIISVQFKEEQSSDIYLKDINGKDVFQVEHKFHLANEIFRIDTSKIEGGVYFMYVVSDDITTCQKISIQ